MSRKVFEKLGYKEGFKYKLLDVPDNYYSLIELPDDIEVEESKSDCNLVHLFSNERDDYIFKLLTAKKLIAQNGMIWVSWYKKSSKKPTELNEDLIRDIALDNGLVDVKVCAIDQDWSGLKLMIPIKLRK